LDVLVVLLGDLSGEDIAHGAGALAAGARVADAHPATEVGREPGGLGLLEQRPVADRRGAVAAHEAKRAVSSRAGNGDGRWREGLGEDWAFRAVANRVDQPGRPADGRGRAVVRGEFLTSDPRVVLAGRDIRDLEVAM